MDLSRSIMVIHGPAMFDSGEAARLLRAIQPDSAIVAGVVARSAAEESGLPVKFSDRMPSEILRTYGDRAFLVNYGRSPESGRIFGEIVAGRLGSGLVHAECACRTVILWDGADEGFGTVLADAIGFGTIRRQPAPPRSPERVIRGCDPGDAVLVNGVVIGRATSDTVVLRQEGEGLEAISGIVLKHHGLEKIDRNGGVDLSRAWCTSGQLRSASPKVLRAAPATGTVLVVDHRSHDLYRGLRPGICGILSIGDDTTAVCGHLCAHLGIPVFGVVDGDADGIIMESYAPGSVVVEVTEGRDDETGALLAKQMTCGGVRWQDWVDRALALLGGKVTVVVDRR